MVVAFSLSLCLFAPNTNNSILSDKHISSKAVSRNRQGDFSKRQAGKRVGQAGLILLIYGLSAVKSVAI